MAAFAVGHRIRINALTIFNERVASPNEVSKEIREDLNQVVHHVNELFKAGCIELVRTVPRGGAVEHFYRAVRRPELSDEEWEALPDKDKRAIATAGLRNLFGEGLASVQTGKMSTDPNMRVWWKAANLDAQGRQESAEEQAESIERQLQIEVRSNKRMAEAGKGNMAPSTVVAVLGFTRSREGQPAGELPTESSD
jgi:hypothetical protein